MSLWRNAGERGFNRIARADEGQKQPKAAVTAASMAAEGPLHESGDAAVSLVLR